MVCNSRISRARFSFRPTCGCGRRRVGADRLLIVEKVQHRGVLLDRAQHVGETAERMRPDRLALERAGDAAADVALGDRDAKVVGPESDQPLDEADRRRAGPLQPRRGLGAEGLLFGGGPAAAPAGRRAPSSCAGRHRGGPGAAPPAAIEGAGKISAATSGDGHAELGNADRDCSVPLRFFSRLVGETFPEIWRG